MPAKRRFELEEGSVSHPHEASRQNQSWLANKSGNKMHMPILFYVAAFACAHVAPTANAMDYDRTIHLDPVGPKGNSIGMTQQFIEAQRPDLKWHHPPYNSPFSKSARISNDNQYLVFYNQKNIAYGFVSVTQTAEEYNPRKAIAKSREIAISYHLDPVRASAINSPDCNFWRNDYRRYSLSIVSLKGRMRIRFDVTDDRLSHVGSKPTALGDELMDRSCIDIFLFYP